LLLLTMAASVPSATAASLESRKSNAAGVQVVVTPKPFDKAASSWDFDVVMDTHSKPLNDDLVRASELIADGRTYAPLGWQGDKPGGHHRKGVLRFPRPAEPPKVVEVQITGIGGAGVRTFRREFK
jgi:hypothetical protein